MSMLESQNACKSCGTPLKGKYCHVCGEKVVTDEDKSAARWLKQLFSDLWNLDGKLLLSLKYPVFRPGVLAKDYFDGRRKVYIKPLNLFFMANLIYFLLPSLNTFKTTLNAQLQGQPYSGYIERMLNEEVGAMETEAYKAFETKYDAKTSEISKVILIILAPLIGLLYYVLFQRQGLYMSDAFNLGLQFWSFFLFIPLILLTQLNQIVFHFFEVSLLAGEVVISVVFFAISTLYIFFQMRPFSPNRMRLTLKVLVMLISFIPLITVYRLILFWTTYLSL